MDAVEDHISLLCDRLDENNLLIPVDVPLARLADNALPFFHTAIVEHFQNHPSLQLHQPFHPDSSTASPSNAGWCLQKIRRAGRVGHFHAQADHGAYTNIDYFQTNKFVRNGTYPRHRGDPPAARLVFFVGQLCLFWRL